VTTTEDAIRGWNRFLQPAAPNAVDLINEPGEGTKIHVGKPWVFGDAKIGRDCKIQNGAIIGDGIILGDGVFVGPGAVFMNDRCPRARNADGTPKGRDDWTCETTRVGHDASIGAGACICPGVTIGEYAFVCAGAVVTNDVPAYGKVFGNPARLVGWVDEEGKDRA